MSVGRKEDNMSKTIYLFADVETTGTNFNLKTSQTQRNELLQIAYQLWNSDLTEQLAIGEHIVEISNLDSVLALMDEYVTNMHTSTGLINRLKSHIDTEDLIFLEVILELKPKPIKHQIMMHKQTLKNVSKNYKFI